MYELRCSVNVGGDLRSVGRSKDYKEVMDAMLDLHNTFKHWGSGEFLILKDGVEFKRLVLDEEGLRVVENV